MSIRSLPLIVFSFVFYNVIVLLGGSVAPDVILRYEIFSLPSFRGGSQVWSFTWGDLILLVTMLLLFAEILKATYTATASLVDHGLSMVVFVACLIEFLLVDAAFTSVFFLIMIAALIDVVAGYTIGIRVARRDIGFGTMDH